MKIQYFAYGSNMLAERLRKRCHSAQFVGVASVLNTTLNFSKLSKDQSGKASFEEAPGRVLFGAVYELEGTELIGLDKAGRPDRH